MMVSKSKILGTSLMAAVISTAFSGLIFLCLDSSLPFIFLLSPFFLILGLLVSLPILYCWRLFGYKAALWAASFSIFFITIALPGSFAIMMALQLIIPAAFIAILADLRLEHFPDRFLPLSNLLSATILLVTISALILAVFLNNHPSVNVLLNNSISEIIYILRQMRTLPPQQINDIELLLQQSGHVFIVNIFAFYSFVIVLANFYMTARMKKNLREDLRRPRDHWLYSASSLPRIQVVLLVGATLLSLLPLQETLQNCLDIISMMLLMSFTLTGLAAIHLMTRGKTWRTWLLIALYSGLVLLFTSIALAFWGIFVSTTPFLQRYKNYPPHFSNQI